MLDISYLVFPSSCEFVADFLQQGIRSQSSRMHHSEGCLLERRRGLCGEEGEACRGDEGDACCISIMSMAFTARINGYTDRIKSAEQFLRRQALKIHEMQMFFFISLIVLYWSAKNTPHPQSPGYYNRHKHAKAKAPSISLLLDQSEWVPSSMQCKCSIKADMPPVQDAVNAIWTSKESSPILS